MKKMIFLPTGVIMALTLSSFTQKANEMSEISIHIREHQNIKELTGEKAKLLVQTNLVVDKKTQSTVAQENVIKSDRGETDVNEMDVNINNLN
ncbi:MAG: hypothetical protein Fur0023_13170 [Bacteroidia bacterium]